MAAFLFGEKMSEKIDTLMNNGKWFRQPNSIDPCVIMGLRREGRFRSFHTYTQRLSVLEHQMMGVLLVPRYCDFMAKNLEGGKYKDSYNDLTFRYHLTMAFASHDLEEIILGDIPSPVKFDNLEEIKEEIRTVFRKYLHIEPEVVNASNACRMGVIHLDMICGFMECVEYKFALDELFGFYVANICKAKLEDFVMELGGDISSYFYTYKSRIENASENESKKSKSKEKSTD